MTIDVQEKGNRPLFISFNGGPGSSSVWMHLGYPGPRCITIDDEGNPVQPYGVRENPYSTRTLDASGPSSFEPGARLPPPVRPSADLAVLVVVRAE